MCFLLEMKCVLTMLCGVWSLTEYAGGADEFGKVRTKFVKKVAKMH